MQSQDVLFTLLMLMCGMSPAQEQKYQLTLPSQKQCAWVKIYLHVIDGGLILLYLISALYLMSQRITLREGS